MLEAAPATAATLPKGEFAKLLKVSAGRVSQMITEGKISPDALEGEGRTAKIKVALAMEQIRRRTDIGQRFGNGSGTNLENPTKPPAQNGASPPLGDPVEVKMRLEKLREVEFRNREAERKELASQGVYVVADEVAMGLGKMAVSMVAVFEGALSDFAQAIAARFELPQRDVLHLLRSEFVSVRERASTAAAKAAEKLPASKIDHRPDPA
jgi:hypothetical protein